MHLTRLFFAAALTLAAPAAQAGFILYKCEVTQRPARSFMSPTLEILHNTETGEARAIDGIIYRTYETDMPVNVVTDNAARLTVQWDVKNPIGRSAGVQRRFPALRETVTILKDTMTLQIRQRPMGFDNSFTGSGRCTATPFKPQKK